MCESVRECNSIRENVGDYVWKAQKYLSGSKIYALFAWTVVVCYVKRGDMRMYTVVLLFVLNRRKTML